MAAMGESMLLIEEDMQLSQQCRCWARLTCVLLSSWSPIERSPAPESLVGEPDEPPPIVRDVGPKVWQGHNVG